MKYYPDNSDYSDNSDDFDDSNDPDSDDYLFDDSDDVDDRNDFIKSSGKLYDTKSPVCWAALHGHLSVVQYLSDHGAKLFGCWLGESPEEWQTYISIPDFHPKYVFETPLCCAARKGNIEIVEFLVEKKIAIDENGGYQELYSSPLFKELLPRYNSPLCWAAEGGHLDVVKCLVEHGANIDGNRDMTTPLYAAIESGH